MCKYMCVYTHTHTRENSASFLGKKYFFSHSIHSVNAYTHVLGASGKGFYFSLAGWLFYSWSCIQTFSSFLFFFLCFNCCPSTVVSISLHHSYPTPAILTSHPWSYSPLALSMCPLYMFLDDPSPCSPNYPLPPPLWLLSVCSLFQCFWFYFACLLFLLIRFYS